MCSLERAYAKKSSPRNSKAVRAPSIRISSLLSFCTVTFARFLAYLAKTSVVVGFFFDGMAVPCYSVARPIDYQVTDGHRLRLTPDQSEGIVRKPLVARRGETLMA